jgi:hypothetical protein
MSANSPALWVEPPLSPAPKLHTLRELYPDGPVQWRLLVVLAACIAGVAGSFSLENLLVPWRARMDSTTPGWTFVLSLATVFGFVAALAVQARSAAVVHALFAATLIGYAYVIAGATMIDPRRAVQLAHLTFRAVELGLVSVAAMIVGECVRLLLRQRLALFGDLGGEGATQYGVADLLFLTLVFAVGTWLMNLFFDHFRRDQQLHQVLLAIVRALPAALPWLWGLTQKRLSPRALVAIVGVTIGVWLVKAAFEYEATGEEVGYVLYHTLVRAVAYAVGATACGLLLRGLGFRWCVG